MRVAISGSPAVLQIHFIQIFQRIQRLAPLLGGNALGIGEVQHRVALRAEFNSLIDRGQKSASPARLAAVGLVFPGEQHHKSRQVGAFTAQSVSEPRTHAGAADDLKAAVHENLRRGVIELRRADGFHNRDIVGNSLKVGKKFGDFRAAFAALGKFVGRTQQARHALDEGKALAFHELLGNKFAVVLLQLGLVVEHVQVRRRARHEEINDALGLGGKHGRLGRHWIGLRRGHARRHTPAASRSRRMRRDSAVPPRPMPACLKK